MTAFFVSVISVHESDRISGGLGGFHYSSIGSIIKGGDISYSEGIEENIMVLRKMWWYWGKCDGVDSKRPWNAEVNNIVLVNNTSCDGRVLKFVLVIRGIKKS